MERLISVPSGGTVVSDILECSDVICTVRIGSRANSTGMAVFVYLSCRSLSPTPRNVAVHWHRRYEHDESNRWWRELIIHLLKEE